MIKNIRNFAVYNELRIELGNEDVKVIYRDTVKILREIFNRLGIVYGKMESPQCLSYRLISHINGNSNFSKDADGYVGYDEFLIEKVNGHVTVMHRNLKPILDEIAKSVGFEFENEKNSNDFNEALINFINAKKIGKISQMSEDEIADNEFISDADWDWWCHLSDTMKYILIHDLPNQEEEIGIIEFYDENDFDTEVDIYDRDTFGILLGEYVTGLYLLDDTFIEPVLDNINIPNNVYEIDDLEPLVYLNNYILSISFRDWSGMISDVMFNSIVKFNKLENLDLSYNRINIDELYKLSKLNYLKELCIRRVMDFDDELVEFNETEFSKLKAALPHSEIMM